MFIITLVEMESVDIVYYINLDHRTDRREQIESEFERLDIPPEKIVRVPAIYTKDHGALGCGLSHCKALTIFLESNHKNCIILEDDFVFTQPCDTIEKLLQKASTIPFDILMFASNTLASTPTEWPFLTKVYSAQTTSGYWITREFAPVLLDCFQRASQSQKLYMERVRCTSIEYCIDQAWKDIQPLFRWYCFEPKLGMQRESYSDIEKKITNYGV